MAKPVKFARVVYMTRRFDEMIRWYENVFETAVVYRSPAFAFMTYDDEHHRFAFANLDIMKPDGAGQNERGEIGVNHVAYTYATAGDLLDTYARLKAAGIEPYWPVHHGTTLSLYYRDPDGNRMEFQVDCGTAAEAHAYMASEAFAASVAGVAFDPDRLLDMHRHGAAKDVSLACPVGLPSEIPAAHGMG